MKQAFTLIELLVVVLIIGILTAVAVPQYQTAVQKSRFAGLMPLARSVKDAQESMHMSTGYYTDKLEDLSVSVPSSDVTITPVASDEEGYVRASKEKLNNRLVMYFAKSPRYANEIHCEAEQENKVAKQVCLSYGGNPNPLVNGASESDGYDTYVLEGKGIDAGGLSVPVEETPETIANALLDSYMEGWFQELNDVVEWWCSKNKGYCEGSDADGNRIISGEGCSISDGHYSSIDVNGCSSFHTDDGKEYDKEHHGDSWSKRSAEGVVYCSSISSSGACNEVFDAIVKSLDGDYYSCNSFTNGVCNSWSVSEFPGYSW